MDQATALALLRHFLTAVGAIMVSRGVLSDDQLGTLTNQIITISGAVMTAAPIIWSVIQKKQQQVAVVKAAVTGDAIQATATSPTKIGAP